MSDQPTVVTEGEETDLGTILAKCDDKSATGHWHCVTHKIGFQNNLGLHSHTSSGQHKVAWVCHAHGPEVP